MINIENSVCFRIASLMGCEDINTDETLVDTAAPDFYPGVIVFREVDSDDVIP